MSEGNKQQPVAADVQQDVAIEAEVVDEKAAEPEPVKPKPSPSQDVQIPTDAEFKSMEKQIGYLEGRQHALENNYPGVPF